LQHGGQALLLHVRTDMNEEGFDKGGPQSPDTLERSMSVGYSIIGALLVFGALGYGLDRWLHTTPWLFLVGLVVGTAIAMFDVGSLLRSHTS